MPTRKKQVRTSGETRMRERGMRKVVLWLDARELSLVAAAAGRRPLATWIREKACHAAELVDTERVREARRNPPGR